MTIEADGGEGLDKLLVGLGYESETTKFARERKEEKRLKLNAWIAENVCKVCKKVLKRCYCEQPED